MNRSFIALFLFACIVPATIAADDEARHKEAVESLESKGIHIFGAGTGIGARATVEIDSGHAIDDSFVPQLRTISPYCYLGLDQTGITNKGITALLKSPVEIDNFFASGPKVDKSVVTALGHGTAVQSIGLRGPLRGSQWGELANLQALKKLSIQYDAFAGPLMNIEISDQEANGISRLVGLQFLRISGSGLRDQHLMQFKRLTRLEELYLDANGISGEALSILQAMPHLKHVSLRRCLLNDRDMLSASGSQSIKSLHLSDNQIGDQTIQRLGVAGFPRLDYLALSRTDVTDQGIASLSAFAALQHLDISQTRVTGQGMASLKSCKNLTAVDLQLSSVNTQGLREIATLKTLAWLQLERTQLDDTAVPVLETMTQLKTLAIGGTKIGDGGVTRLRQSLPNCKITVDETVLSLH